MTSSLFTRLQELAEKATPGEWVVSHRPASYEESVIEAAGAIRAHFDGRLLLNQAGDAEFVVALRNSWPQIAEALQAAQEFRAEHPAWSPDNFTEDSILEVLQGGDSAGARLDDALASVFSAGQDTGAGIAQSPDGDVRGGEQP